VSRGDQTPVVIHGIATPFVRTQGANVWPSDDPRDVPSDSLRCSWCGWETYEVQGGSYPTDMGRPSDWNRHNAMIFHMDRCPARPPADGRAICPACWHKADSA
jgi:hypothetical protein